MDNLSEKLKEALPEQKVPSEFKELVKNAYDQSFEEESPSFSKGHKGYIFLIVAIVFILILLFKR